MQFKVLVKTNNGLSTVWTSVVADNLHNAYQLAYAQYGRDNVMMVTT